MVLRSETVENTLESSKLSKLLDAFQVIFSASVSQYQCDRGSHPPHWSLTLEMLEEILGGMTLGLWR